ncbi:DDB1- and CUL4-associated factor-like protein 1 [Hibiscus syriacus]|uniref:DDB1-and CUL4-associated factor-like protein 1 n=1 Tax=Hibiscus syriacus TaxID=106335 RepID=A0A6A2ZAQ9_HIBSY|nr:DDB1- and CUL4-associated factor-like protein 1 [Hibiscus syriacus]
MWSKTVQLQYYASLSKYLTWVDFTRRSSNPINKSAAEKECLETLGEYVEVLGPVLHEKGVDVCLALLQRSFKIEEASKATSLLSDVIKLICALAAHRKFAALFVDRGGMQKLLAVPRVPQNCFGLYSCLFTVGSVQGIMERVCALPSDAVHQVVELAIQLPECPQDQVRKNAALFFAAAFVFRAVLDAFDAQDGLSGTTSFRNERSPSEALVSSEKQIAYHACVALQQYFRAHLVLLVDSIRPNNSNRNGTRSIPSTRVAYNPLDVSNEAMDAVFLQLQKDRKLGSAFVWTRWPAVGKFLSSNGHIIMLELCQATPIERYLHDLLQYALGVLHIVTLVPISRKMIVNATLSNNRAGIAVILDAANSASSLVDPEIIQLALNVLINVVCPPPSISNKPPLISQGQKSASGQTTNGPGVETRNAERNISERSVFLPNQCETRKRSAEPGLVDRSAAAGSQSTSSIAQAPVSAASSGLVLLHLLQPCIYSPPAALDCLQALACRVLVGLARDETIAHILTKLLVGKKLSKLIRDSGGLTHGTEQGRWQSELAQVAIELIAIVTNSRRASTLAATDAATPTLRRIERAAIAAATPITFHSSFCFSYMEHLQASGLAEDSFAILGCPFLSCTPSLRSRCSINTTPEDEDINLKCDSTSSLKKKSVLLSFALQSRNHFLSQDSQPPSVRKAHSSSKSFPSLPSVSETRTESTIESNLDSESNYKTPLVFPMKRKLSELKALSGKRLNTSDHGPRSPICLTPNTTRRNFLLTDAPALTPTSNLRDQHMTPSSLVGLLNDPQPSNSERLSLDSIVVQYLKHQHRQCPAPITTLPPLSLLHPHVCLMPKRSLDAPTNITSRLGTREFGSVYGGVHGNRRDHHFVYSRFSHGELAGMINNVLDSCSGHQFPVTLVQSYFLARPKWFYHQALRVCGWDAFFFSGGAMHSFEGCKAARFSNSGSIFASLSSDSTQREILLYDIQTYQLELKLSDTSANSTGRGHVYSPIHFSPSDTMLLWNGVLWDRRVQGPVHRFDQFTDYGGGGFHPAGNEVIINSEVWDLWKFWKLRSLPSLDQTAITFNARGDVIYPILRRNLEDVMSAVNTRRVKHPLFAAFRTLDAVNYSDIATILVDRCVLDFATEATDSFVGLITMDDQEEVFSSARVHEIGRRRPTDDDSDPDDAESDEDEDDDDVDIDPILGPDINRDGESDADEMSSDDDSVSGLDDDDGDFIMDDGGGWILEFVTEGEDDDDDSQLVESFSSGEEEDFARNGFGF